MVSPICFELMFNNRKRNQLQCHIKTVIIFCFCYNPLALPNIPVFLFLYVFIVNAFDWAHFQLCFQIVQTLIKLLLLLETWSATFLRSLRWRWRRSAIVQSNIKRQQTYKQQNTCLQLCLLQLRSSTVDAAIVVARRRQGHGQSMLARQLQVRG